MISKAVPYEGHDPYLFLIFAQEDTERLAPLIDCLDRNKIRIWYHNGSQGNENWLDSMEDHLEDSRAVIAFVTEAFGLSHSCKSSVISAMKCRKKVIPAVVGSPALPKGLRMQLGYLHSLSRSDFDSDEELMTKLCKAPECQACRSDISSGSATQDGQNRISVIPEQTHNDQNDSGQQQTQNRTPALQQMISRLFPKGISVPRPEFRLPELFRKKIPQEVPEETVSVPEKLQSSVTAETAKSVPDSKIPEQIQSQKQQSGSGSQLYVSRQSDSASVTKPEHAAGNQLYVSSESSSAAASVTIPQHAAGNQLYVSSESGSSAASVTIPQHAVGSQLYVSSESSSAAASVTIPQHAAGNQLYVSSESSSAAAYSTRQQTAAQSYADDNPTVLDRRLFTVESFGQPSDDAATVLIHNRVSALLFHVRAARAYTLRKPQTKLGRSPIKCDVVLEGNDSISKLHAELRCYNQKFFLLDAGSKNGTYLMGRQLQPDAQVQLPNPVCFHLNDEPMILVSGDQAKAVSAAGQASLLVNSTRTNAILLDGKAVKLNRNSKWFDGTLNDPKVHRAAHAQVRLYQNGYYLVDESPENGNGTSVNQYTLRHGEARRLNSGDRIQLGDTTLTFLTIPL